MHYVDYQSPKYPYTYLRMNQSKSPSPPRWVEGLLERLAARHLLEEVQGDLQELFDRRLQRYSVRKARLNYIMYSIY